MVSKDIDTYLITMHCDQNITMHIEYFQHINPMMMTHRVLYL
jgi:hypothetical protein